MRPERLQLSASRPAAAALEGTLDKVVHLGFVTHCTVRLANGQDVLAYRLSSVDGAHADLPAEKQRTYLWWNEADAWAYAGSADPRPPGPPFVAHPPRGD